MGLADAHVDTATQRPATGLDAGARELVIRIVGSVADLSDEQVVTAFFHDRYGGPTDYFNALEAVWGTAVSYGLSSKVSDAVHDAEMPLDFRRRQSPGAAAARTLLLNMPEPDFRSAIADALRMTKRAGDAADRITQVCRNRGIPWVFSEAGFEYTGDEVVTRDLTRPALAAINRSEFSGGVKSEYESARSELAKGNPSALKQAVHEAGCAVESAMKVVLDEHNAPYGAKDAAKALFDALVNAGIVERHMESLVLVAMTPRNRLGGHGAGAAAHVVDPQEAESIVANAGGAIAYLATRLP